MKLPPYVRESSGQPRVCWMSPGCTRPSGSCHSSFIPRPYDCGLERASRLKRRMSCLARLPRAPSATTVVRARTSAPGVKLGPGLPSLSRPMSPSCTPATTPSAATSGAAAAKPGKTSTPRDSAFCASQGVRSPREMMKLPRLCSCGGNGSFMLPLAVSSRNSFRTAGTQISGGESRHSGASASSGPGSITAPDRACAPTAAAFSSTQTLRSCCNCFNRMAHDSPAGPAPTITTSYSMTSRWMSFCSGAEAFISGGLNADCAIEADGLAVQHRDLEGGDDELRELLGFAEALRKGDLVGERGLQIRAHGVDHRRVEDARGDGDAADTESRELPRDRQRHAGKPRLGRGVGRLADLTFEGGHGGRMHQQPALAILGGTVVLHQRRGSLVAQERTDQIDVHDLGEEVARHRAILPQHAA